MCSARLTEPAHAVGEPRRCEPHLCVSKPLADFAEDVLLRDAHVIEANHAVPAGEA
jgi:hypothetical protein